MLRSGCGGMPVRFWTCIILGYTCIGMIRELHLL
jgi:hypothetical protein